MMIEMYISPALSSLSAKIKVRYIYLELEVRLIYRGRTASLSLLATKWVLLRVLGSSALVSL